VHEEAFGTFEVPDPAQLADPATAGDDLELPPLVWEAVTALNPRDYAVLDLHVRQGLEAAAIAQVMNVNKANAQTMVTRMKAAATDVIGSYAVARRGAQECEGLRIVLAQFEFPPYTAQVRAAIDTHIAECAICRPARAALPPPLEIYGALMPVAAPLWLKGDVWRDLAAMWGTPGAPLAVGGAATALAASPYAAVPSAAGGYGGSGGFPVAPEMTPAEPWDRRRIMLFAGAVLGLLIFAFAGAALVATALGGDDGGGAAASGTGTPAGTGTPRGSVTPGVIVETATPDPNPSPTPRPSETPTAAPTEPPPPSPVPIPPTPVPPPVAPSPTPPPPPTPRPPATQPPNPFASPTPCLTEGCPPLLDDL
jgi:hypothetical protein